MVPQSYTPNKWVFNDRLNCPRQSHCRRCDGSLFHMRGQRSQNTGSRKGCTGVCRWYAHSAIVLSYNMVLIITSIKQIKPS